MDLLLGGDVAVLGCSGIGLGEISMAVPLASMISSDSVSGASSTLLGAMVADSETSPTWHLSTFGGNIC